MPRLLAGGWQRLFAFALAAALLVPLLSFQAVAAQDETGGPGLGDDFYDPPACSPAGSNGLVVYQSLNAERTTPNRGLIVANAAGERERVVPLDGIPIRVFATPYPNHAIVITGDEQGNAALIEVVDAARGFRYPLDIPRESLGSLIYPSAATLDGAGTRYIVLSDIQQRSAFLVDLREGVATDLMAIAQKRAPDETITLTSAMVSPDDRMVLLATSDSVLLIPTDNPEGDRKLGTAGELTGFAFINAEEAPLIFTRTLENGSVEVVLYDTSRFAGRQIAVGPDLVSATPLPNGEAIILATNDALVLLDLDYLARSLVASVSGEIGTVLIAPRSGRLAYEILDEETSTWRYVNLRNGITTDLPELAGLSPFPGDDALRWLLFAPSTIVAAGNGGAVYYSLDLETGAALPTLVSQDGTSYLPAIVSPGEGRFSLVPSVTGSIQQYDLTDNRAGHADSLLGGRSASAVLSPNGCWAAVARVVGDRTERNFQIYLVPLDRQTEAIEGESGIAPVWLTGS